MVDPALAEAAAVTGLLTLGGVVLVPRAVVCVGAGAALGWAALGPVMLGSAFGAALGFGAYLLTTLLGVLPQSALFVYLGLAGGEALTSRAPLSLNTLVGIAGVALTVLALWRVKAAVKSARRDLFAADA